MRLRSVHRASAIVIGVYATFHIANHLLALGGVATHQRAMEVLRWVYRFPAVEILLVASVSIQIATGLWLFLAGLRTRKGAVSWIQAGSGAVLGIFLMIHVAAIFFGRYGLHLDTNFYYAAAGMHVPQARGFFAPYYFLGVLALFVHVGCALHRIAQRRAGASRPARPIATVGVWAIGGAGVAGLLLLLLSGVLIPVQVPPNYLATFEAAGARSR